MYSFESNQFNMAVTVQLHSTQIYICMYIYSKKETSQEMYDTAGVHTMSKGNNTFLGVLIAHSKITSWK